MNSRWPRAAALTIAAGFCIATSAPPQWSVFDEVALAVELSEGTPTATFLVSVTYDVPDEDTTLFLTANARIERSIGSGETLTVVIDADDGLDGGATDSRDLARTETFLSARAELGFCGRPCERAFVVSVIWDGAPFNDFTTVDLEINASATGGDSVDLPAGADVQLVVEPL